MDFLSDDSPWSTTWLGDPQGVVVGGKEIAAHALLYLTLSELNLFITIMRPTFLHREIEGLIAYRIDHITR